MSESTDQDELATAIEQWSRASVSADDKLIDLTVKVQRLIEESFRDNTRSLDILFQKAKDPVRLCLTLVLDALPPYPSLYAKHVINATYGAIELTAKTCGPCIAAQLAKEASEQKKKATESSTGEVEDEKVTKDTSCIDNPATANSVMNDDTCPVVEGSSIKTTTEQSEVPAPSSSTTDTSTEVNSNTTSDSETLLTDDSSVLVSTTSLAGPQPHTCIPLVHGRILLPPDFDPIQVTDKLLSGNVGYSAIALFLRRFHVPMNWDRMLSFIHRRADTERDNLHDLVNMIIDLNIEDVVNYSRLFPRLLRTHTARTHALSIIRSIDTRLRATQTLSQTLTRLTSNISTESPPLFVMLPPTVFTPAIPIPLGYCYTVEKIRPRLPLSLFLPTIPYHISYTPHSSSSTTSLSSSSTVESEPTTSVDTNDINDTIDTALSSPTSPLLSSSDPLSLSTPSSSSSSENTISFLSNPISLISPFDPTLTSTTPSVSIFTESRSETPSSSNSATSSTTSSSSPSSSTPSASSPSAVLYVPLDDALQSYLSWSSDIIGPLVETYLTRFPSEMHAVSKLSGSLRQLVQSMASRIKANQEINNSYKSIDWCIREGLGIELGSLIVRQTPSLAPLFIHRLLKYGKIVEAAYATQTFGVNPVPSVLDFLESRTKALNVPPQSNSTPVYTTTTPTTGDIKLVSNTTTTSTTSTTTPTVTCESDAQREGAGVHHESNSMDATVRRDVSLNAPPLTLADCPEYTELNKGITTDDYLKLPPEVCVVPVGYDNPQGVSRFIQVVMALIEKRGLKDDWDSYLRQTSGVIQESSERKEETEEKEGNKKDTEEKPLEEGLSKEMESGDKNVRDLMRDGGIEALPNEGGVEKIASTSDMNSEGSSSSTLPPSSSSLPSSSPSVSSLSITHTTSDSDIQTSFPQPSDVSDFQTPVKGTESRSGARTGGSSGSKKPLGTPIPPSTPKTPKNPKTPGGKDVFVPLTMERVRERYPIIIGCDTETVPMIGKGPCLLQLAFNLASDGQFLTDPATTQVSMTTSSSSSSSPSTTSLFESDIVFLIDLGRLHRTITLLIAFLMSHSRVLKVGQSFDNDISQLRSVFPSTLSPEGSEWLMMDDEKKSDQESQPTTMTDKASRDSADEEETVGGEDDETSNPAAKDAPTSTPMRGGSEGGKGKYQKKTPAKSTKSKHSNILDKAQGVVCLGELDRAIFRRKDELARAEMKRQRKLAKIAESIKEGEGGGDGGNPDDDGGGAGGETEKKEGIRDLASVMNDVEGQNDGTDEKGVDKNAQIDLADSEDLTTGVLPNDVSASTDESQITMVDASQDLRARIGAELAKARAARKAARKDKKKKSNELAGNPGTSQVRGLTSTAQHYLGKPLFKGVCMSDWARKPLLPAQTAYAALDAWVSQPLLERMVASGDLPQNALPQDK